MKRRLELFAGVFTLLVLWECAHQLIATGVRIAAPAVQEIAESSGVIDVTAIPVLAEDRGSAPPPSVLTEVFGIPAAHAQNTIDVQRVGAVGDGTTDDATAFQLAATRLVNTGGVIWVPPDLKYKISSTIDIRSYYPIYVVSQMGQLWVGSSAGYITPGATLSNGIFRWRAPNGETNPFENGGGGVIGLGFHDPASAGAGRTTAIDSCIYIEDAINFLCERCYFLNIDGRALRIGNTVTCRHTGGRIYGCGNTSKPAVDVAGGPNDAAHNSGFVGYYGRDVIIEASYSAPAIKVAAAGGITIDGLYLENDTGTGALQNSFIECAGNIFARNCKFNALGSATTQVDLTSAGNPIGNSIIGCEFRGEGKAIDVTSGYQQLTVNNNFFRDAGADAVDAVTFDGGYVQFCNNTLYSCGKVTVTGPEAVVCNNRTYSTLETTAGTEYVVGNGTVMANNTGYTATATATGDPGGSATLNAESGSVTSPALTTAEGATWVLTLSNNRVSASSRVMATVSRGTASAGFVVPVLVQPGTGTVTIAVLNTAGGGALNGTIKVNFVVHNAGAWILPSERQRRNRDYVYSETLAA